MTQQELTTTKYSGAGWLERALSPRLRLLSKLGVKVANILGQTFRGIYHINDHVLSRKVNWEHPSEISLTICRELASFDGCELTMLFLCCQEARVKLTIAGAFKGYLKLTFSNSYQDSDYADSYFREETDQAISPFTDLMPCSFKEAVNYFFPLCAAGYENIIRSKDTLCFYTDKSGELNYIERRLPTLYYDEIAEGLAAAHYSATRIAISGRCPAELGLSITLSKRQREGSFYERHPDLETSISCLKKYWKIDYCDRLS